MRGPDISTLIAELAPREKIDEVEALLAKTTFEERLALAAHPDVTLLTLAVLARTGEPLVKSSARQHVRLAGEEHGSVPALVAASLTYLDPASIDTALDQAIAITPVPPEFLSAAVAPERILAGAAHAAMPEAWCRAYLEVLAGEPAAAIREQVAAHPRAPMALLEQLAGDANVVVRRAAASRVNQAHLDAIEQAVRRAADALTTPRELEELARSRWSAVQWAVAANTLSPAGALERLSGHPQREVRRAVAANPATGTTALCFLLADRALWPVLALRPNVPAHLLIPIAAAADVRLRCLAALHREAPAEALEPRAPTDGELTRLLAAHPNLGPSAFEAVARSEYPATRVQLLASARTPPEVVRWILRQLAASAAGAARRLAAAHPALGAEMLAVLAADPDPTVRAGAVANPTAPVELLKQLALTPTGPSGADHADASHENRAYAAAAWPDPLAVATPEPVAAAIARNPATPRELLEALAGAGLIKAVTDVWTAAFTPLDDAKRTYLATLAAGEPLSRAWVVDLLRSVHLAIALNPRTPDALRTKLVDHLSACNDPRVQLELVLSPHVPAAVRSRQLRPLLAHPDVRILMKLAASPIWSPATRARMLSVLGSRAPRSIFAGPAAVPRSWQLALAHDPAVPPELLACLAESDDVFVRIAVAPRPDLPQESASRLARDPDSSVRAAAVHNPAKIPVKTPRWLWQDDAQLGEISPLADPRHEGNSAGALAAAAHRSNPQSRATAAGNPATPPAILARLAGDAELEVRQMVASNPATVGAILLALESDRDSSVRRAARANRGVRPSVAAAMESSDEGARGGTTSAAPADLAERASSDRPVVRYLALLHPAVPAELLEERAQSPWWPDRQAVVENPSTSEEIVRTLASDSHRLVRAAARHRLAAGLVRAVRQEATPAAPEPVAPTESALAQLTRLIDGMSSGQVFRSEGGDDLTPFTWSGEGVPQLSDILRETGFMTSIKKQAFLDGMVAQLENEGRDENDIKEFRTTWKQALVGLEEAGASIKVFEISNFTGADKEDYDDRYPVVVVKDPDGSWWAMAPACDDLYEQRYYGAELPVKALEGKSDLQAKFASPPFVFMRGQQSGTVEHAVTFRAGTMGEAIDGALQAAHTLCSSAIGSLGGEDDPRNVDLANFFIQDLENAQVHVIGNYANFDHFVFGRAADGGWVGFWTNAAWT